MLTRTQYLGGGGGAWFVYVRKIPRCQDFEVFAIIPDFTDFFRNNY